MSVRVPVIVDYDPKALRQATGDLGNLDKNAKKSLGGLKLSSAGAALGITGLGAAAGLAAKGLSDAINAAKESEASNARLKNALEATNVSYEQHSAQIEKAIQATSKLAAVDDEELQDAFSNMVRKTGDVDQSLKGMALAADIARARNVDLSVATKAVENALIGKTAALKKLTGDLPAYTGNVDEAKKQIEAMKEASDGKLTPALKAQAKEMLETAKAADAAKTKTEILEAAQAKFAGSAEAYGKTAKGAQERLGVAIENLQEKIGEKLLPVMARLATEAVNLLGWIEANWPAIQKVIEPVINAVTATLRNMIDVIRIIVAIFKGDWSKAWELAVGIVKRSIDAIAGLYKPLLEVGLRLGSALLEGIGAALSALGSIITNALTSALNGAIGQVEKIINGLVKAFNATFAKLPGIGNLPTLSIPRIEAGSVAQPTRSTQSANITINAGMGADGAAIGDAVITALQEWQRRNGLIPVTTR